MLLDLVESRLITLIGGNSGYIDTVTVLFSKSICAKLVNYVLSGKNAYLRMDLMLIRTEQLERNVFISLLSRRGKAAGPFIELLKS